MNTPEVDELFPGFRPPPTAQRETQSAERKQEILEKYSHDNVVSTFQSSKQVADRKAKLRLLKQMALLENTLLRKSEESDAIREEIQELKVEIIIK
jgi:hypothetical protein